MVQSVAQEFVIEEDEEENEPPEETDHDELTHFMHQLEQQNSLTWRAHPFHASTRAAKQLNMMSSPTYQHNAVHVTSCLT